MQALFKLSKNFYLQYENVRYEMDSGHKKKNCILSEVSTTIFTDFMRCRNIQ